MTIHYYCQWCRDITEHENKRCLECGKTNEEFEKEKSRVRTRLTMTQGEGLRV